MTARPRTASISKPSAHVPRPVDAARLRGRGLAIARAVWVTFAAALLVIFLANIPALFHHAGSVCMRPEVAACPAEQLTPAYVQVVERLHVPLMAAQFSLASLCVAVALCCWLLGLLIFWRKSDEWIGLLVSLLLVMFGAAGFLGFNLPTPAPTLFELLAQIVTHALMWPAMLVFYFTFPTGRFAPRWTYAAFVPFFTVAMLDSVPASLAPTDLVPGAVAALATLPPIAVQGYRYARVYDPVQRQQTKWFVFGLAVVAALLIVQRLLQAAAVGSDAARAWYGLFGGPFWLLSWTLLPLIVSISVLRYRLWDIDVIIRRTLIYGSLTATLGGIYLALVLGTQAAVRGLTGQNGDEPILLVASTLLIAALFTPLRRRLQAVIDQRFYRRKYDAARTLEAFGATLRQQVELGELSAHLTAAVEETMRPAHVSLWLRTSVRAGHDPNIEA